MVLAIEADGATYHSSATARDRDRLRQEHLERLGWRFHRIWSTDWFRDPDTETAKVLTAYHAAVRAADSPRPNANGEAATQSTGDAAKPTVEFSGRPATASAGEPGRPSDPVGSRFSGPPHRLRTAGYPRNIRKGQPIGLYSKSDLVALIRWIESDDLLRTEDELMREAMRELGFNRKGAIIASTLTEAIRTARRSRS